MGIPCVLTQESKTTSFFLVFRKPVFKKISRQERRSCNLSSDKRHSGSERRNETDGAYRYLYFGCDGFCRRLQKLCLDSVILRGLLPPHGSRNICSTSASGDSSFICGTIRKRPTHEAYFTRRINLSTSLTGQENEYIRMKGIQAKR